MKYFHHYILAFFFTLYAFLPVALPSSDIPADNSVLIERGNAEQSELPPKFKMLVWNIQKAEAGERWQKDFQSLAAENDVLLLQEGYLNSIYENTVDSISNVLWLFATSFIYQGHETGVTTGTRIKPFATQWLRSPGREPLVNSPKMSLLTQFNYSDSPQKLLIANIHGINFVANNVFNDQINQVVTALEKHQGPMIFAGDFNTWNDGRMNLLKKKCKQLGLSEVVFKDDTRKIQLDHIFYRDLTPHQPQILSKINSSDHYPLSITFSEASL